MDNSWNKRKLKIFSLVTACLLLLVGYKEEYPMNHAKLEGLVSIAHRGAAVYAPENTRIAFQKGLELGADILECDVHLSKDGQLIIMHDEKVDRTTNGKGFIKDFTLEELRKLDAGGKFHRDFTGEPIITLDELLEEFYGHIGLLIEIKKPLLYPGIEEKVALLLENYENLNRVIVQSFDIESMRKMHHLVPELQIAILMKASAIPPSLQRVKDLTSFATYINFNILYVNERIVDQIHNYGGKVLVWSVKTPRLVDKAYRYNVDGIITDFSHWPEEVPFHLVRE
ncbi:glycerophosphodiester phosphodiesterase [Sporosarcina sp. G11-34]|uniref:glycerophosphodiester phosphodiesterase n=1 Tax=Sporosarcina sp. G11-34 TaxID=2849605 RepID=UPI0022A932D2|nr:glycerophosphodiester phosphodiesterase family protein [Sporosarcina sp. G11-34]MCZ2260218.1 glycerophosphodiester phosphodiesterase [Sporosarcina sp. G11-34]